MDLPLLVLAGGFGTRLRSVVSDVPKPLAPVCHKPFLYYLISAWKDAGIKKIIFLLHYQAQQIQGFLDVLKTLDDFSHIEFLSVVEKEPLGTGGAIAYAVHEFSLQGAFLVANADTWLDDGVEKMLSAKSPALGVVYVENADRYGNIVLQHDKILSFSEKTNEKRSAWINAGIYHLTADLFLEWRHKSFSLENDYFPILVKQSALHAVKLTGHFIDIGIPEDYLKFSQWIESNKKLPL